MKKFLWITALFVILLAVVLIPKAKTQALAPDAKVVYEHDDYIWTINIDTKVKTKIAAGNYPAISDKSGAPSAELGQNEIAYILKKDNSHFDAKKDKEGIYIYNLSSGGTKYINYPVTDLTTRVLFSPTSKYLLVETHISTYNTQTLITRSGKVKMSFRVAGNQFRWLNNKKIVYTSLHNVTPARPRGTGGGSGFGVSKITNKGKITVLRKSNALIDYTLFGMNGPKIQFIKYKVSKQSDWSYDNYKKSYWKMNQKGKNVKKTYKLVPWATKIKNALPAKYKDYQVIDYGSPIYDIDYRLFIMNKTYDVENEEIYIMDLAHKDTLKKLAKGHTPNWGWSLN
ncbi:MAG: hypothetical protein AB1465_03090 [Patescibacteria group bacterium]